MLLLPRGLRRGHPVRALLADFPVVLVNAFARDGKLQSVVPDEYRGGYEATGIPQARGHRRIGLIDNLDPVSVAPGCAPTFVTRISGWQEAGYEAAMQLLQLPDRPTALFCVNARAGMGALAAAQQLGLEVPRDLSIIGFDNQEIVAAHLRTALTTMPLPHAEMGHCGARMLLGELPWKPGRERLHCPPLMRHSVGPRPG
jgi:LacI family transcriptional regulator